MKFVREKKIVAKFHASSIAVNHLAIEITFPLKGRSKPSLEIIYNY